MTISEIKQQHRNETQRLRQKYDREIKERKNQIEVTKDHYNKMNQQARLEGADRIDLYRRELDQNYTDVYEQQQEKLNNLRNNIIKTEDLLNTKHDRVQQGHLYQLSQMSTDHAILKQEQTDKYTDHMKALEDRLGVTVAKLKADTDHRVIDAQYENNQRVAELLKVQDRHITESRNKHDYKMQTMEQKSREQIRRANIKHDVAIKQQRNDHALQMRQLDESNFHEIDHKEKTQRKQIKSLEKNFAKQVTDLNKRQQDILKRLDQEFKVTVNNIKDKNSEVKDMIMTKSDDDFYRADTLDVDLEDHGKFYLVKMQVPPHEKDSVTITPQDRSIKINLTRRFQNDIKSADGTRNVSKRSELFSKTLPVREFVDPNKTKQKYEDGVLSVMVTKK